MAAKTTDKDFSKNKNTNRKFVIIFVLLLISLFFFVLDLMLGSIPIPLVETLKILTGSESENLIWENIIQKIRLPRAITAVLAGAALSVAGLQMQTLFRNPLAGPSILGITAGASLGVALVMLSSGSVIGIYAITQLGNWGSWLIVSAAMLGSALVLTIVLLISLRVHDNVVMLIVGIMVGNITLSLITIWQYFSSPDQIQDFLLWTFGSLGGVTQEQLWILIFLISCGIFLSFLISKSLNLLLLGEHYAQSMGLTVRKARILIVLVTSILAGSITSFAGPIGFIGIAVPHLCRSLFNTADHRILIPACCLIGASLMLLCDMIAKMPGTQINLPINAVTALIGAPIVIGVILRAKNLRKGF